MHMVTLFVYDSLALPNRGSKKKITAKIFTGLIRLKVLLKNDLVNSLYANLFLNGFGVINIIHIHISI